MKYLPYLLLVAFAGCASTQTLTPEQNRVAVDTHVLSAQLALRDQRPEDAAGEYLKAARLSDDPALAERAARMAQRLGLTEAGLEAVKRWRQLAPDDERAYWFAGIFQTRAGHLDQAVASFKSLIDKLPGAKPGTGLALIVEGLSDEPDPSAATRVMSALNDAYPNTPEGHYSLARLAMRSGDFGLALKNAQAATALKPKWLDAQLLYARTLLVAGRTEASLTLGEKLAKQNKGNVDVELEYAELLLSAGHSDKAETKLNDILEAHPGMPEAVRALGFLELTNKELDAATEHFDALRNDDGYKDEAFYYLGRIAETQQQYLKATRSYARVTDGTHAVDAQMRSARIILTKMNDADGALRHLKEFGQANPRFASQMLLGRAELLVQMKKPHQAVSLIDAELRNNPDDATLQNAQVQFYVQLSQDAADGNDLDAAEKWLQQGLDRYPQNTSLLYSQALLLQKQGHMRKSVEILRSLVKEHPDNAAFLNALGYLLTDKFSRYKEARGYIQRALAMEPDSPAIIDSMGWVLYKLGDYDGALDYLQRAYRLEKDPEIAAHLVQLYWAHGQRQQALQLLDTALKKAPDSSALKDVAKRLGQ
jgi:tetratricopeptide (TPR) repeat protein